MKDELFQELLGSVREGGAILRGEQEPARRFEIPAPDVRELRQKAGFSQREFATLMGISPGTLRNWEQGRRQPEGAARVLLAVAARHPKTVWGVVRSSASGRPRASRTGTPARRLKSAAAKRK